MSTRDALPFLLIFLSGAIYAQSLADLAKQEKERRKATKAPVRVIDQEALEQGSHSGVADAETGAEVSGAAPASGAEARTSSPPITPARSSPTSSLDEIKRRRQQCAADLEKAQTEKRREQALFEQGAARVETIEAPRIEIPEGTLIITGPPPAGSADVAGPRVSCRSALSSRSKYAVEAGKCEQIQRRIQAAEEKIQRATECLRSR